MTKTDSVSRRLSEIDEDEKDDTQQAPAQAETGPGRPVLEVNQLDQGYFLRELLEAVGWDLIYNEVKSEEGGLYFKSAAGKRLIFESFDNVVNVRRVKNIASIIDPQYNHSISDLS